MGKINSKIVALRTLFCAFITAFSLSLVHAAPAPAQAVPGEIVVKVPAGGDINALARQAGCSVVGPIAFSPRYYLLEVSANRVVRRNGRAVSSPTPVSQAVQTAVAQLRTNAGVLADPNWAFRLSQTPVAAIPDDPFYGQQSNLSMIRMPEAWSIQIGARPVTVAVIDSGLDTTHPDFVRLDGTPAYVNPIDVSFPTFPSTNVIDTNGHGTHVSGIIAATTNNAIGVASVAGWRRNNVNVRLMPIKGLSTFIDPQTGSTNEFISNASVIAGVNYALQQGANVVNMSFGLYAGVGGVPTFSTVIATAQQQGMIFVAALGNDASNVTSLGVYPASLPGVIAVSAVNPNRTLATYSNFGGAVAIGAPGGSGQTIAVGTAPNQTFYYDPTTNILSTFPTIRTNPYNPPNTVPAGYASLAGTSMAAPHVTGAVALLLAAGTPSSEIRSTLQSTAQPLDEAPNVNGGNKYGAGLLDVYAALQLVTSVSVRITSPQNGATTEQGTVDVQLRVRNVSRLVNETDKTLTIQVRTASEPSTIVQTVTVDKSTLPNVSAPASSTVVTIEDVLVIPGQLIVEAIVSDATGAISSDRIFLNGSQRRQTSGRSMFSVPYIVSDGLGGPESLLFTGTSFSLQRWDPLVGDYARFLSNGQPQDTAASFRAVLPNPPGGAIVYRSSDSARSSIAPVGLGYWLDLASTVTLNITGTAVQDPVAIRLFASNSGWNMIGAPFTFPVDWNIVTILYRGDSFTLQEAIDNNIIRSALVGYASGDYVFYVPPRGQLMPWNAYWVQALRDCVVVIPPTPSTSPLQGGRSTVTRPATDGWRVRLAASVAGDVDGQNYLGQADSAKAGDDRNDIPEPPAGAGKAYVRFLQSREGGRSASYAYDIRPSGEGKHEWTVAVTSAREDSKVNLTWEGLSNVPRRSRLVLTDTVTKERVPMASRSSYTFQSGEAGSTRLFTVTLEPALSAGPLAIMNMSVAGGRAVQGMTVRFTLNQEAEVSGTVTTMSGKTVATLTGASRAAGATETTLRWDGRQQGGATVPAGPYLIEVRARSTDGQTAVVKRPVIMLR